MSGFFVNNQVLAKLTNYDKQFVMAYLFVKLLSQFTKHPILYNFAVNKEAYRIKMRMGVLTFNRLLKLATAYDLVKYHGDNLHLISHTQERRLFNVKSNHQTETTAADLQKAVAAAIIIKNIKSQKRQLAKKALASTNGTCTGFAFQQRISNHNPVLSCRKAGQLLKISHTSANRLLSQLKGYGLTITKNIVQISKSDFRFLKAKGSYNIRYKGNEYLYLGANLIDNKKVPVCIYSGYSYCSNDI